MLAQVQRGALSRGLDAVVSDIWNARVYESQACSASANIGMIRLRT